VTLPQRKKFGHDPPGSVRTDKAVFFITICCDPRGQNQLCCADVARHLLDSVAFRNRRGDWWVHFLLLMPDHLHMLMSFPSAKPMAGVIAEWKKFIARTIGIRWQRDFFDHRLRKKDNFRAKEDYIRMNPVRAGLVSKPENWPYVWMPTAG
jgi:REP element-mobilizing transposase RayT